MGGSSRFFLYSLRVFGLSQPGLLGEATPVFLLRGRLGKGEGGCVPAGSTVEGWRRALRGSYLLDGVSGNQSSLLPTAELQKHFAVFQLPHADLRGGEETELCCLEGDRY